MTRHAAYSKYLLLPRENPEGLDTLLKGVRQDFEPRGTTEEEVVSEIAIILWRKRRVNRLLELELSDAELAREGEKSTKQHAGDVCRLAKSNDTNVNVQLTDVVTSLKGLLEGTASLGKLGANLRSFLAEIEELRPIMEMAVRSLNEAKKMDRASNLDRVRALCELDARLDAQIEKKIRRLIMVKEYQRQYGRNSNLKLLSHQHAAANKEADRVPSKKGTDTNDNWNENDDDNDNDNQINPDDYDWEHEYDEALAEQKKARRGQSSQED